MLAVLQIYTDLGLSQNNGECLEIIKTERQKYQNQWDSIKSEEQSTIQDIRGCLRILNAYDVLIDNFEKYLGHER